MIDVAIIIADTRKVAGSIMNATSLPYAATTKPPRAAPIAREADHVAEFIAFAVINASPSPTSG